MEQSRWLKKKIADRQRRESLPGKKQRKEIVESPSLEEENALLNKLLDEWEIREYGKVRTN